MKLKIQTKYFWFYAILTELCIWNAWETIVRLMQVKINLNALALCIACTEELLWELQIMILISKLLNIPFKRFRIWYAVFVNFGLHFIHVSYILWISFFSNFKFSCILLVYHAGKFPQNASHSYFHHYLMHPTFLGFHC